MTLPPPPPVAVVEPERPPRPAVVTTAGFLLYLLAALQVIGLLVSIPTYQAMGDVFPEVYKGTPMEDSAGAIMGVAIGFGALIVVIFAAGFITLGILDLKGKQPARIITWVMAGLLLCCAGAGAATGGSGMSFSGQSTSNGVDPEELQRQLEAATPGWVQPVSISLSALQALIALAVVILLALPAANAYFRKPAPNAGWAPPYPTYPTT